MESPTSPNTDLPPPPAPNPEEQHPQQQSHHHHQRPQSPVSKRRKVEHRVVITVRVEERDGPGKHKHDGPPSDLWSWRKYGQKPIKGSPYPRGYYRCSTSKGCSAKKQVERCRTDASLLVITYTSTHNHAGPDLQQIATSTGATGEYKALESMDTAPPTTPSSGHSHSAGVCDANQTSRCTTAAGHGDSDSCITPVPPDPSLKDDGREDAGPELPRDLQASSSVGEAEQDKPTAGAETDVPPETNAPPPPNSSHDHGHVGESPHQETCSAEHPQHKLLDSGNAREVSTPMSSPNLSGCSEVSTELITDEPLCSKIPTTFPTCEVNEEEDEQHPNCEEDVEDEPMATPSPQEFFPEAKLSSDSDKATHADTHNTLQPQHVVPFDQETSLSSTQTASSSDEFDFYDELDELPPISPWTSIPMGSFFEDRILLHLPSY